MSDEQRPAEATVTTENRCGNQALHLAWEALVIDLKIRVPEYLQDDVLRRKIHEVATQLYKTSGVPEAPGDVSTLADRGPEESAPARVRAEGWGTQYDRISGEWCARGPWRETQIAALTDVPCRESPRVPSSDCGCCETAYIEGQASRDAELTAMRRHYDAAAPEHNLLALLDLYNDRARKAEAELAVLRRVAETAEEMRLRCPCDDDTTRPYENAVLAYDDSFREWRDFQSNAGGGR